MGRKKSNLSSLYNSFQFSTQRQLIAPSLESPAFSICNQPMALLRILYSDMLLSLILFLSFSNSVFSLSNSQLQESISVYDILPKYGLPSGLLPSSVSNYSLADDGRFVVLLEKPCYIQFDYLVYYDRKITGKLSYGLISDLDGIEVKKFFIWLDVDEIKVDLPPSDSIYFKVGIINKKLDIDQFKSVHSCRDGVSGGFFNRISELPTAAEDVEMLVTE